MGKRLEAASGHCVKGNKKAVVNHYNPMGEKKKSSPLSFITVLNQRERRWVIYQGGIHITYNT